MPYTSEWKLVDLSLPSGVEVNPNFKCPGCGNAERIEGRVWESPDESFEDYHYRCISCGYSWWVDGTDA